MDLAPSRRGRVLAPALLALLIAATTAACVLLGAGGRPSDLPGGLPDAGAATGWALRGAGLVLDLAAALTVGGLLVAALLREPGLARARTRARGLAALAAGAWSVSAATLLLLEAADTAGVPLGDVTVTMVEQTLATGPGAGLALTAVAAAGVAAAGGARSTRAGLLLLLVASSALVPAAMAGHASSTTDPDVMAAGLVVHVVSASLWVGGLVAVLVLLRDDQVALSVVLPRFSVVALSAFAALTASGILAAVTALGTTPSSWAGPYGAVLALKVILLVGLGSLGHQHRRRTLALVATGRVDVFLRVAGTEVILMGAAFGAAAGLAMTPLPDPVADDHVATIGPDALAPFSLTALAFDWRVDAVALTVLVAMLAAYIGGVRRLARLGVPWPVARTAAWTGGVLLAVVALCSGLARYAPVLLSAQVTQLLLTLLVVPALLVRGAPLTLWRLVRPPGADPHDPHDPRWARLLTHPLAGGALVVGLLLLLYRTPAVELALEHSWARALVLALALVSGSVLLWPLVGTDPVPAPRETGERMLGLTAVAGCLLALALQLRLGDQLLAGSWFIARGPEGAGPVADQRLAGAIVAAAAAVTILALVHLARSGGRQPDSGQTRTTIDPRRSRTGTAP